MFVRNACYGQRKDYLSRVIFSFTLNLMQTAEKHFISFNLYLSDEVVMTLLEALLTDLVFRYIVSQKGV